MTTTRSIPGIPQELTAEILNHLWDDENALKACSLACRAFLHTSQQHLFSKIVLWKGLPGHRFRDLLRSSPHLSLYVEYFEVSDLHGSWVWNDRTSISFCLSCLSNLRALVFHYPLEDLEETRWNNIIEEGLLDSLIDTLHLPSLTYLNLFCFPPALLIKHGRNLTHLVVESDFTESYTSHNISSTCCTSQEKISMDFLQVNIVDEGVERPRTLQDLYNTVDVTTLKRFSGCGDVGIKCHHDLWSFMKACAGTLEELDFEPCSDAHIPEISTMDPIDWSTMTALRVLRIRLEVTTPARGPMINQFPWFMTLLDKLSPPNTRLEELVVHVNYAFCGQKIEVHHWAKLSALLLDRNRFPRLRKVEFWIAAFVADDVEEIMLQVNRQTIFLRESSRLRVTLVHVKPFAHLSFFLPDPTWISRDPLMDLDDKSY
ncbi:hypothetical protein GALMADRAFT_266269 [Galerina marginata CBS 339.88]|uniref:F-box domain-containing protein n=1 Tax=Galerina marginata (strain CBS 339.88) TaxID=685588 RepID=A0A067T6M6_GALM3|nr:hypothetical protein GALMADRAFT_266269 [Galerina marginata CBS 339.88]